MKKGKEVLRDVRKAAAPVVKLTRDAAREVFKQVKAAHKASVKAVRRGSSS